MTGRVRSKATARKRAQRRRPRLLCCDWCGSTRGLQRHHPDIEGEPDRTLILCLECHKAEDIRLGKQPAQPVHRLDLPLYDLGKEPTLVHVIASDEDAPGVLDQAREAYPGWLVVWSRDYGSEVEALVSDVAGSERCVVVSDGRLRRLLEVLAALNEAGRPMEVIR